jgi:hypothetical protein
MDKEDYAQVFRALDIPIQPIPSNYSPEEFGRKLFAMSQIESGVCYAASTDYAKKPSLASKTVNDNK